MNSPSRSLFQSVGLWLGVVSALVFLFWFDPDPARPLIGPMAAIVVLMSVWWITEAVPLAATALLPFALFPLARIMNPAEVSRSYLNPIVFLFLGGFLIALAMERWNLHRRVALAIISRAGGSPRLLVLGFLVASAFLSMWISNTATALMMLPIALAVVGKIEETHGRERSHGLSLGLLLATAYGASIGGVATLVGTPPNLVLARVYTAQFPQEVPFSFGQWMLFALPLSLLLLLVVWWCLTRGICRADPALVPDRTVTAEEMKALGPWTSMEKRVGVVFVLTAMLWIFREDINFGFAVLPGWSRLWTAAAGLHDGTVAVLMALTLFLIPARGSRLAADALLDEGAFARIPWNIILLFGGGFALADGFGASGLSAWISESAGRLAGIHPFAAVALVSGGLNFLTELTSNTATTQMMLPLLASISLGLGIHPRLLMVAATVSASMAFMMPVATPPNAIVFGSGRVTVREMARVGLILNLLSIVLVTIFVWWVLPLVFDLTTTPVPAGL